MADLLVLVVIVLVPAVAVLGPLAILTLGIAAIADYDGNGLVRPQPAAGSSSSDTSAVGSRTTGPASRMSSVTPSA